MSIISRKRGPKTQYDANLHPRLFRWFCRAGMTDEEMASEIGISVRQLYRWYRTYPELCQAKKEKQIADFEVEDSLFKRAIGYEVEEAEVVASKDGRPTRVKKIKRHIPPDVTAAIFWLKNRQPKRWRRGEKGVQEDFEQIQIVDDINK